MVDGGKRAIRSPYFAVGIAKALESLLLPLLAVALRGACSDGSLTGDVTS